MGHFHRVSVPELMRRESSADADCRSGVVQLFACGRGLAPPPTRWLFAVLARSPLTLSAETLSERGISPDLRNGRPVRQDLAVPTVSRFFGIVIAMYFDDHDPPHFHARHAEGAAKVRIDTLEPIESTLGRRQLRFVLAWAELHQAELLENWRRARDGETLNEIDPLQ